MFSSSILLAAMIATADLKVAGAFTDHMVLQQSSDAPIWGWSSPGEKVTVQAGWGVQTTVKAGADGKWMAKVKTPKAGGPFAISISTPTEQKFLSDVLIGEVWVCSGQSNMQWAMSQSNSNPLESTTERDILAANYPNIRLFTVPRVGSRTPQVDVQGQWLPCTPESVRDFSAVAYFFGRDIHTKANVPVGLISTNVGGTESELWTSEEFLRQIPDLAKTIDNNKNALDEFQKATETWASSILTADKGWPDWSKPDYDDSTWAKVEPITKWFKVPDLSDFDGIVWFRSEFEFNGDPSKEAKLTITPTDDMDVTFINGYKIGQTNFFNTNRSYAIPAGTLKQGKNQVTVRVHDTGGDGGFSDEEGGMLLTQDSTTVKISNFRYQKSVPQASLPQGPSYRGRNYSTLYNAMIHPLIPLKIRGAIWYQGEANVDRAYQYRQAFPKMIECWRKLFKQGDFPFYFVQIAPFTYGNEMSPELREAQLLTMQKVKNTGMVVVSDATPNVRDIHPQDKLTPGVRLARWALAKVYGQKRLEFSGPIPSGSKAEGPKMRVKFDHAKGLKFMGEPVGWEIAAADKKYYPAKAAIDGESVVVWSDQVTTPVAVRLGWTDAGIPNLFNADGLPTTSFRTDDWPGLTFDRKW